MVKIIFQTVFLVAINLVTSKIVFFTKTLLLEYENMNMLIGMEYFYLYIVVPTIIIHGMYVHTLHFFFFVISVNK